MSARAKISVVVLLFAANAHAGSKQSPGQEWLNEFRENPVAAMNRPLPKTSVGPSALGAPQSLFSREDIQSRDFILKRAMVRDGICKQKNGARICAGDLLPGRAEALDNDRAEELVDNPGTMLTSLEEIEGAKLQSSKLEEAPWSDDYWPIYKGILAYRYADDQFPAAKDWKVNRDYLAEFNVEKMLADDSSSVDKLSPSEKYDLLVGDTSGGLTAAMWKEGERYFNAVGKVETWMGICHGWAPASFMIPRPKSALTVLAADGKTKIKFYPSDIKALASLLWAKGSRTTRFIGGRCKVKEPKLDENGRVISADCFDTNPGTWHLAVVNQIGVSKRSFVMDATYDYEVWNQPVYGYSYQYFNPKTFDGAEKLSDAKVRIEELTADRFKSYRSPSAKSIVGIMMSVTYMVEVRPRQREHDGPEHDALKSVQYSYDLELDEHDRIIGGEWYSNLHPDFLWVPEPDAKAASFADRYVRGGWTGKEAFPSKWSRAAERASSYGQPLGSVVDALVLFSRIQ